MYPFLTVGAVGEYDVDCGVIGGGTSGQSMRERTPPKSRHQTVAPAISLLKLLHF